MTSCERAKVGRNFFFLTHKINSAIFLHHGCSFNNTISVQFINSTAPCKRGTSTLHVFRNSSSLAASIAAMGQPSFQASNAVIYLTYGAFL